MGNKTVMISVLNRAYANDGGLFDIFLEGFRKGENTSVLLDHQHSFGFRSEIL